MIGDLHCHTRLSDGSMSIDDLIFYAKRADLSFLAITDHDTMDGVTRGIVLGKRYGVRLIPGVELSCWDKARGRTVHMLCYLPDNPDRLLRLMKKTLNSRMEAAKQMIAKVTQYYPVTEEHIMRHATGSKTIYESHIMQALMDLGYDCQSRGKLYWHLFHPEDGICFVRPELPGVYETLEAIHQAGGMAVMAHPPEFDSMELLEELCQKQLIHGAEAFHPRINEEEKQAILELTEAHGLLTTGGSDFHGYLTDNPHPLASCAISSERIDAIFRAKKQMSSLETV